MTNTQRDILGIVGGLAEEALIEQGRHCKAEFQ